MCSKEMIEYLSKEIETKSNALVKFRHRINLPVFFGPFIVLGAYLITIKGDLKVLGKSLFSFPTILYLAIIAGCFLFLGYQSMRVENIGWKHCNDWRRAIYKIQKSPHAPLEESDFDFTLGNVTKGYLLAYLTILIIFVFTLLFFYTVSQ